MIFKRQLLKYKHKRLLGKFKSVGENVSLPLCGEIAHKNNITIGNHCYIGRQPYIYADGGINIGDGTIIGPKVCILTSNHNYDSDEMLPYDHRSYLRPVVIGKGCWIGANVQICPGVTVGNGVVIAMGSVVTKNVKDGSILGGNPAKIIKQRDTNLIDSLINSNSYYLKAKSNGLKNIYLNEDF